MNGDKTTLRCCHDMELEADDNDWLLMDKCWDVYYCGKIALVRVKFCPFCGTKLPTEAK